MHVRVTKLLSATLAVAMLTGVMILGLAIPASAHEGFEEGKLSVNVGFAVEPAYEGYPNAVELLLSKGEEPVTELKTPVKVEVKTGSAVKELTFEPNFEVGEWGIPGDYLAGFIPTQPGTYSFHVTGTIDGQKVDVTAVSGPETFSDVLGASGADFPVRNPTTGELSTKLDQETARLNASISKAEDSAKSSANTALIIAGFGAVLGLVGIAFGITARRTKPGS